MMPCRGGCGSKGNGQRVILGPGGEGERGGGSIRRRASRKGSADTKREIERAFVFFVQIKFVRRAWRPRSGFVWQAIMEFGKVSGGRYSGVPHAVR